MPQPLSILGTAFLCVALLGAPSGRTVAATLSDTIDAIRESIVGVGTVQVTRRPPARLLGTGFVVGDGRHVLTNAHVIPRRLDEQKKEFLAVFIRHEREGALKAEVVRSDPEHDVALLRFSGARLPAMSLGDSERVREGELYAFSGFPIGEVLGLRPVTHRGIVSAITPIVIPQHSSQQLDAALIKRLNSPYDVFQLDATAYPGNSGSPLFDPATGQVVGVINMVFVKDSKENVLEKPSGITYAIPISYAKRLLDEAGVRP